MTHASALVSPAVDACRAAYFLAALLGCNVAALRVVEYGTRCGSNMPRMLLTTGSPTMVMEVWKAPSASYGTAEPCMSPLPPSSLCSDPHEPDNILRGLVLLCC